MDKWWVPGCTIGYEHTFTNSFADFLASLEGGPRVQPHDARSPADAESLRRRVGECEGWFLG